MINEQGILDHIVGMFGKVLEMDENQIETNIHIQDLGINSIKLVEFVEEISEALDEEIHPGVFFEYTTLESFASYLHEHKPEVVSSYLSRVAAKESMAAETLHGRMDSVVSGNGTKARTNQTIHDLVDNERADIEESFLRTDDKSTLSPDSMEWDSLDDLPVIIGGGIGGLLISRRLSQKKIPHVMIGKPLLGDSPKLGESMTESVSIEFARDFKEYSPYFYPKEVTPFFMGKIVSGLRFSFFPSFVSLFQDDDKPATFIHVDRIGFDQALYEEVKARKECRRLDSFVTNVEYDEKNDQIKSLILKEGRQIKPSYVWDCTNHVRLLGRKLDIPSMVFDDPRQVFFTHYTQKGGEPLCRCEDIPWIHATSLLRADKGDDGLEGISWLIPLGHYISVGISMALEDVGDKTPEEIITLLTKAYQSRGLDYTPHFPRRKEIINIPSQHFMYDRFVGKNWAMVGGSAASTWFTSGSNISMLACMASMADKIIEQPEVYGEHYSRHVKGFLETQKIYDTLLESDLGAVDAMKFLSGIVEQGRKRISSFFMFRLGLESEVARRASTLWHEDVVIDKTYFEYLRQIATHAAPDNRSDQTSAIFQKLSELRCKNGDVRLPYLKEDRVRSEKPELFLQCGVNG